MDRHTNKQTNRQMGKPYFAIWKICDELTKHTETNEQTFIPKPYLEEWKESEWLTNKPTK